MLGIFASLSMVVLVQMYLVLECPLSASNLLDVRSPALDAQGYAISGFTPICSCPICRNIAASRLRRHTLHLGIPPTPLSEEWHPEYENPATLAAFRLCLCDPSRP